MTRRYCTALLNHAGRKVPCGKVTTGENLQCDDCIAYRAPIGPRPRLRPRCKHPKRHLCFGYLKGGGLYEWHWRCKRCHATWRADDLADEDAKIVAADPHLASLYGEPAV